MNLPLLRYLDILIGISVVALLASTIVAAVTQFILASTYTRARNLRDSLKDLVAQFDPKTLSPWAGYIAERMLRHPLLGRDNTAFGLIAWKLRHHVRVGKVGKLPLPCVNPPDAIEREEIILLLLEWASDDGAMHLQDQELVRLVGETATGKVVAGKLIEIREALCTALRNCGIGDPAGTARAIRAQIMQNEHDHPEQSQQLWRAQAVTAIAPSDLVAKLNYWYDNSMARATQSFALTAKVLASVIALGVVALIQIDAANLLRRIATDDQLRAGLVAEADIQTKRIEEEQKKGQDSSPTADDARRARDVAAASLAALRDPSHDVVPSYLALQRVAQTDVCENPALLSGTFQGKLLIGPDTRPFDAGQLYADRWAEELATAVRKSGAPVSIYDDMKDDHGKQIKCLRLVALSPGPSQLAVVRVNSGGNETTVSENSVLARDNKGFRARLPGIIFMWVLVSLGAPFWYDLLKKLVGLRSLLAQKDDNDRKSRQQQQGPVEEVPPDIAAPPLKPVQPVTVPVGSGDERGDLDATGAEG